jgi:hypothetical protein
LQDFAVVEQRFGVVGCLPVLAVYNFVAQLRFGTFVIGFL